MSTANQPDGRRLDPDAVYSDGELRMLLGITDAALSRAKREGRLRCSRQGKRTIYRGAWIISWLEADADQRAAGKEAKP